MSNDDVDVIVVGAGPVGLTLAIALRRLSLQVRVVDKATKDKRQPRAGVLWPRALEAMAALGVGETLRRHAFELRTVTIYGQGRRLGQVEWGRLSSAYPRALGIEQHDVERLLAEELTALGVDVEWQTEAVDVHLHPDHVEALLRRADGSVQPARASWVIGCEGTASVVRERLGIPFQGARRPNLQIVQGNATPTWSLGERPGHGYFFLAPRRSLAAIPVPGGGYRFFCFRDDPDPTRTDPPTLQELRDLVADTAGIPDLSLTPTQPLWLNRARFADRVAATFRRGRGLLAGDAAHAWAPVGGHGLNIGVLGAFNLAWKLAAVHHGQAHHSLLDTYSQEQRAIAHAVIRDMHFNFLELPLPRLGYHAFATSLPLTLSLPGFQRRLEWALSDLGRHHRSSSLSWQHARGLPRSPRAGDRIADITVVPHHDAATPQRLHDLLSYRHWTLLIAASRADPATLHTLQGICSRQSAPLSIMPIAAVDRRDTRHLPAPDHLALVRPDGHIGLLAPLDRAQVLEAYLAGLRIPGAEADHEPGLVRQKTQTPLSAE